ncbi:MAG TPA: hypothetical protein VGO93_18115 [Candidatus Xenobia bacterium]
MIVLAVCSPQIAQATPGALYCICFGAKECLDPCNFTLKFTDPGCAVGGLASPQFSITMNWNKAADTWQYGTITGKTICGGCLTTANVTISGNRFFAKFCQYFNAVPGCCNSKWSLCLTSNHTVFNTQDQHFWKPAGSCVCGGCGGTNTANDQSDINRPVPTDGGLGCPGTVRTNCPAKTKAFACGGTYGFVFSGVGGQGGGNFDATFKKSVNLPEVDAQSAALPVALALGGLALVAERRSRKISKSAATA